MRYVQYIGLSHVRHLSVTDWRSVGINGDAVQWDARNGFAVPLDQFTDEQIRKAIEPDPNFVITGEEDDEFEPTPQRMDMTPAQLDQAVNAPVDVLDMANGGPIVSTALSDGFPDGTRHVTTDAGVFGGTNEADRLP